MTVAAASPWTLTLPIIGKADPVFVSDFCFGLVCVALWSIGHGVVGLEGDARIYIGRALADLDPAGVGRDLMFAMDGQSAFTVFRLVARTLAAHVGFDATIIILTTVNSVAWLAAIVTLARVVTPGRALVLTMAAICVLPRPYAPWHVFSAGEALSIPRPLAEAGVLLALTSLCRGRYAVATCCLAFAALLHPIMALPGIGVLLIVLGQRDRRWFVAAAACVAGLVGAGALGLPIASRLTATIDPAWSELLQARNPYLFLRQWTTESFGLAFIQAVTIFVASRRLDPRVGSVLRTAVVVAGLGCAISAAFGDGLAVLLIVQAQLWRALWLVAALAPLAAGVCLSRLTREGPAGQIALALLCLAWGTLDLGLIPPLSALAAVLALSAAPHLSTVRRPVVLGIAAASAVVIGVAQWTSLAALEVIVQRTPAVLPSYPWVAAWSLELFVAPVLIFAWAVWRWPASPAIRVGGPVALAAAGTLMWLTWDVRTEAHRSADAAQVKPDLIAQLATRPGEILWLDGDDVWYWARKPNWGALIQGSGIVFSRAQAMAWGARAQAIIADGLAPPTMLRPWSGERPAAPPALDRIKIGHFCARSDAPAWVVAPLDAGAPPPADLSALTWAPSRSRWRLMGGAEDLRWHNFQTYALIPCAGAA